MIEKVNTVPARKPPEDQEQPSGVVGNDAGAASFCFAPGAAEPQHMDHLGAESRSDDQNRTGDSHLDVVESLARVLARSALRAVRGRSGDDRREADPESNSESTGASAEHGR